MGRFKPLAVKKKYAKNGEHCVDLDIWTETRHGEKTTMGKAIVSIPARGYAKHVPLEKLHQKLGLEESQVTLEIEMGLIRKFAEAIGDSNPLWQDEEYGKRTKHGGIIAPPFLLCAIMTLVPVSSVSKMLPSIVPKVPLACERTLDGGGMGFCPTDTTWRHYHIAQQTCRCFRARRQAR